MSKSLIFKLFLIVLFVVFEFIYFKDQLILPMHTLYLYGNTQLFAAILSLGVILAASIYNLSFFVYIRKHQYLYYGLAQLATFIFLLTLDSILISPFDEIIGITSHFAFDLSRAGMQLFSLMFIYYFLQNYHAKNVLNLISVIIILTLLDIVYLFIFSHTIFTNYIPLFILIWLVLSEAYNEIKEKDFPFYFLLIGWSISIIIAVIEHVGFVKITGIVFPFLHVSLAIESIFLSLAIAYKFKLLEEKQKTAQALLLQRSRLASMGEMLSIIAHQWRQPLNFLSMVNINLNRLHQNDTESQKLLSQANKQISYMSDTIDSFREFYNPAKNKEKFTLQKTVLHVISIIKPSLQASGIRMKHHFHDDIFIYGNKNEFEQVILNLINNAKDALLHDMIQNPHIMISLENNILSVSDNAKGIDSQNIKNIFTPYFSTKKDNDGIGLYISKMIIEQELGGKLEVKSDKEGSTFNIIF